MAKQILEIEVPEGKKAIWKDNRIVFEDIDTMKNIKTVDDAIQFLSDEGICEDILDSLSILPENSFEWKVAALRAVVAAITHNERRYLTTGERWYPSVKFCHPGRLEKDCDTITIGRIKSKGKEFDVVGGYTFAGLFDGIGHFQPSEGVSSIFVSSCFRSVNSKKAALYISKQFGKLLFEVCYGGTNCDWRWV